MKFILSSIAFERFNFQFHCIRHCLPCISVYSCSFVPPCFSPVSHFHCRPLIFYFINMKAFLAAWFLCTFQFQSRPQFVALAGALTQSCDDLKVINTNVLVFSAFFFLVHECTVFVSSYKTLLLELSLHEPSDTFKVHIERKSKGYNLYWSWMLLGLLLI